MAIEVDERADEQFVSWAAAQEAARPSARSDSGRRLEAFLLTILAAVGALPAVRLPVAWLGVCAVTSIVLCAAAVAPTRAATKGSVDLVVVPVRALGRLLHGCINPFNWLKAVLCILASLAVGALAAAVIAAGRWIVVEGPGGILAAIRMGVWSHAPAYATVFACYLLLSGVGRTHERRAVTLYRRSSRLPEAVLAGITFVLVAAAIVFSLAGPTHDVGFVRDSDGLGWVPPGLRTSVDGLRDDLVDAELEGVTRRLSGDLPGLWTYRSTAGNPSGDADVATLVADPARAPEQATLAVAALVAHDHLAPWVEAIEISIGDQPVLMVDRSGLATDQPLLDADELRAHAMGAPEWLSTVAPSVDRDTVLRCCGAHPVVTG